MADPVVLINIFEVPDSDAEEFIATWERTWTICKLFQGMLTRALHQATSPGADFQFVNTAHWRSAEEFTKAIQSEGFRESAIGLRWPMHPTLYRIASIG